MTESKLLEGDKDEWFFHSLKRYTNLYMFELEFALDAFEVINETSLCVSGVQSYSKKCEILQLCVPPKLLRSEDEEGLCKDRDFKILSGGYADGRIRQIKCLPKYPNLVATLQNEYNGVIVHEVGNDDRATILEKNRLSTNILPDLSSSNNHKSLCSMNNRIVLGAAQTSKAGGSLLLHEWETGSDESLTRNTPTNTYSIWENASNITCGQIVKMKEWDMNTCIFLTTQGTIALYDLRNGKKEPDLFYHSTKSSNNAQSASLSTTSSTSVIFSFDCLPPQNKVGVLDSCGGYETCDVRCVKKSSEDPTLSRTLLPEFTTLAGVYPEWFNIEYEPLTEMREKERNRFIISGTKKECVPVFQEPEISSDSDLKPGSESLQSVFAFSHDGHSKPVSHSIWHPVAKNLVFSASVDAILHAWQFISEEKLEN